MLFQGLQSRKQQGKRGEKGESTDQMGKKYCKHKCAGRPPPTHSTDE